MSVRAVIVPMTVCLLAACAIQQPPPGGPQDQKPPGVIATSPAAGDVGVAPDAVIELEFDEYMTRTRLERLVTSHPRIRIGKVRWKKNTFILVPEEPLQADTTYVVELQSGYGDAHGVKSSEGYRFGFATSAAIDSGVITGSVFFRRQPSQKARIRLFVLPRDTTFMPEDVLSDREVAVDPAGEYRFDYLPTDDKSFLLWAYEDTDGNGGYGADRDVAVESPDTVSLSPTSPIIGDARFSIVDPKEPARITGRIINSTGFEAFPISITMHELSDSTPPSYVTHSNEQGDFVFADVLRGTYMLWAFMDVEADSLCGSYPCPDDSTRACAEPCVQYPDTLTLEPGEEIKLDELILEPPNGEEE